MIDQAPVCHELEGAPTNSGTACLLMLIVSYCLWQALPVCHELSEAPGAGASAPVIFSPQVNTSGCLPLPLMFL